MLELGRFDLEDIATALADQTDYEHRWLVDPRTGEAVFWTSDTGIDGENPVDLDELDLIPIDPLPSWEWYQDMADFAHGLGDTAAGRRLTATLQGRGAFRRFKNQVYEHYPELISAWHTLRDAEPSAGRSSGCWTRDSSTTAPHNSLRRRIQIPCSPKFWRPEWGLRGSRFRVGPRTVRTQIVRNSIYRPVHDRHPCASARP